MDENKTKTKEEYKLARNKYGSCSISFQMGLCFFAEREEKFQRDWWMNFILYVRE